MAHPSFEEEEKKAGLGSHEQTQAFVDTASIASKEGHFATTATQYRKLESYHVNLIAFGGTIGTAIFIYTGAGLTAAGPLMLLLGYITWVITIFFIAECQREMVVFWPTDTAFSRNAARYIDEAAGFATSVNFWLSQIALCIFEVVAFTLVIGYWESATNVNAAVYISILIGVYTVLNIWDTRFFGNSEFIFAIGKVILISGLLVFTFITMLGGNPIHDRFGFRYWKNPGPITTPFPNHPYGVGRLEGFFAILINACFTLAGPDYLSMTAGEARNPRKTMNKAFKATIYRLVIFFIGTALAIGILVPYNDPNLLGAQAAGAPGGARSPYVIAMNRMMIPVLPNIVNALILTSVFSAGSAYLYCSSRNLAQMARDGQAPKIFARRNRNGVPYVSVAFSLLLTLLAYCQVSTTASVVITYLTGLVGAAQLVNWIVMSFTWIRFNAAHKAQGISRDTLPVKSRFLPFGAWYALISSIFVTLLQGYTVFLKGNWDTASFLFAYTMPILFIILYFGWKVIKRTRYLRAHEIDITSFKNDPEFTEEIDYSHERSRWGNVIHNIFTKLF